jgi:outer membrane protein OmpA-like peptidoglycan-associated protein
MDALAAKGIDKSRILSVGWGQEKPVADKETVSPMGTSTCGLLHLRNQNQKGISVKPMQSK